MENEDIELHPLMKIGVVALLLGPLAGGFLIADNLKRLGKKSGNVVLLFLSLIVVEEVILNYRGYNLGIGLAFLNMSIVYLIMIPAFKDDTGALDDKKIKKYPPAVKPVLYGFGLELLIIFFTYLLITIFHM